MMTGQHIGAAAAILLTAACADIRNEGILTPAFAADGEARFLPDDSRVESRHPNTMDYCKDGSGIDVADTPKPVDAAFLDRMKAIGVSTIARYYDYPDDQTLPDKLLTTQEADLIRSYDLNILTVFQHNNNDGTTFINWAERGPKDAEIALELAKDVKQPAGSAIYFGVDGDFVRPKSVRGKCGAGNAGDCTDEVVSYFTELNKSFKDSGYLIGVYGSGYTCDTLRENDLVRYCWLSQSTGHYGTRASLKAGEYDIHQLMYDKDGKCSGRWLNFSRREDNATDYGQFR